MARRLREQWALKEVDGQLGAWARTTKSVVVNSRLVGIGGRLRATLEREDRFSSFASLPVRAACCC
jgi:hypothetical protein